jgi:uncharacterized membrane protein YfcA
MDALGLPQLVLFVIATFAGAIVAGLSGFAFGLIAASVWLYVLTPAETASLITFYALMIQGIAVWRLRRAIKIGRVLPFVIGGAAGVPLGVALLLWVSPNALRAATGVVLLGFSLHGLARPKLPPVTMGGRIADAAVGLFGGALGGATGLAGILTILWCGLRGWPRDEQRMVFQPTIATTFVMIALWLGGTGLLAGDTLRLFLIGAPALVAGHWLGLRLYGHLDEARFRRVVLVLLLVSGAGLVIAPSV